MHTTNTFLEGLVSGDRKIISDIYIRFYPKVKTFILQNKGSEDDVQDVFQDALMYLITTFKENPKEIHSFEAYLFTICKNIWRRSLKKEKKHAEKNILNCKFKRQ